MPQTHSGDSSRLLPVLLLIPLAVGAAGCSDSTGNPVSPTSVTFQRDAALGVSTGTLSVMMTDTPFSDAMAVFVTIAEASVHRTGGGWQALPLEGGAITCDLKQLEGPVDLLGGGTLPAGKYTQIRLTIDSAAIYFDNPATLADACAATATVDEPLGLRGTVTVSSGVVKLNRPFNVPAGGTTAILLDFDGDRSIRRMGNPNTFRMNPVIAVVGVDETPGPASGEEATHAPQSLR